jgi:His-Xaa-Ser system radical SAM maturase HxsC
MRLVFHGPPAGTGGEIVGTATWEPVPAHERNRHILLVQAPADIECAGYAAAIAEGATERDAVASQSPAARFSISGVREIKSGHILAANPLTGTVRVLYRPESRHNVLFATEMCNSNCVMCSQPPKDHDDREALIQRNLALIDLIREHPLQLTVTGGEPTLLGDGLVRMLSVLRERLPKTHVHVLTNGRLFSKASLVRKVADVRHPDLTWAIPLYADVPWIHDHVVQSETAFVETLRGLRNLALWGQRAEIRIVLQAPTVGRLPQLAEFIQRNLTFVEHIAFMGLEHTGFAVGNLPGLWIDPADYQDELRRAVTLLTNAGMNVSIYNLQLCVLTRSLWPFARRSISDWKNVYDRACDDCAVARECCGFFQWNLKKQSRIFGPIAS